MRDQSSRSRSAPTGHPRRFVRGSQRNARQSVWLFGRHAVLAALANPARHVERLFVTDEAARRGGEEIEAACKKAGRGKPPSTTISREEMAGHLPAGAVHQGIALLVMALDEAALDDLLARCPDNALVLALDQVTDPHNVGAILRSAAALGVAGVVTTERHAPSETGVLAKAASGALEIVPLVRTVNLVRALDQLKAAGFWIYGFDERGDSVLGEIDLAGRVCTVLGAEGEGLRRLTAERCDRLVTIATSRALAALNVSNAAAIVSYEWARRRVE